MCRSRVLINFYYNRFQFFICIVVLHRNILKSLDTEIYRNEIQLEFHNKRGITVSTRSIFRERIIEYSLYNSNQLLTLIKNLFVSLWYLNGDWIGVFEWKFLILFLCLKTLFQYIVKEIDSVIISFTFALIQLNILDVTRLVKFFGLLYFGFSLFWLCCDKTSLISIHKEMNCSNF